MDRDSDFCASIQLGVGIVMARSFNGSSDQINVGSHSILRPGTALTQAAWVNISGALSTYTQICGNTSTNNGNHMFIKSTRHIAVYMAWANTSNISVDPATTALSTNTWYHIGFTYDGTNGIIVYVNGVSDGTNSPHAGAPFYDGTEVWNIGYDSANASRIFNGSIADVVQWNVALTAFELLGLARGARPYLIRPAAIVGWWPLDGLQSPEVDLSGNANNGTLSGTAAAFGPSFAPFTPRWSQVITAAAAPTTVFRRSLSALGTRTGSRQAVSF
jgi:hypothetical protein